MEKGVILAGGKGTRLLPITRSQNKHLVGVLNIPMILYPIHTLKQLGVKEIMIVSGGDHIGGFAEFLMDGSDYGVSITYRVQKNAGGIADALKLVEGFVGDEQFAVVLGDNFFADVSSITFSANKNTVFVKMVDDPWRFGVYIEDKNIIVEKPNIKGQAPVVTGLYIYNPNDIFPVLEELTPSERGELEVTNLNNSLLKDGVLDIVKLECFWSDMGTPESLYRTVKHVASTGRFGDIVV